MNDRVQIDTESSYSLAEEKAVRYFATLQQSVVSRDYQTKLREDMKAWARLNKNNHSWTSRLYRRFAGRYRSKVDDRHYMHRLEQQGRLDAYLERSVSYIYLRDLGKRLDQPNTEMKINKVVASLKGQLLGTQQPKKKTKQQAEVGDAPLHFISFQGAYRWAQKEGVELAVIWVIDKLRQVAEHLPAEMNAEHAQRKLVKIIVGVVMHAMEEMDESTAPQERMERLDKAIRLGYCYGLTYPFIDDLLDSEALNVQEKKDYSSMLRQALSTGVVPELERGIAAEHPLLLFVYRELTEAFQYVKDNVSPSSRQMFFELAYVFFHAQETDRVKWMSDAHYTNEQLYIPIILKSAASRLIARLVLEPAGNEEFEQQTFYYGIYNQLADDFADMFDDQEAGAVTPYTYYLAYYKERQDLIHPFQLYWAVIAHLLHHVYGGDPKTRAVLLGRALGGLRRFRAKHGAERYEQVMQVLTAQDNSFFTFVEQVAKQAEEVDFLDKYVRDHLVDMLKNEKLQRELFSKKVSEARDQINTALLLANDGQQPSPSMRGMLVDAANYSLEGRGKRLRPIMSWIIGVEEFDLSAKELLPLLRSLEYMHTASLIIDDLPSQDNADSRRGRPTLHTMYDSATAELTSLMLMQRAVYEQASLKEFNPEAVLAMMRYSSQTAEQLCIGQMMDLNSMGKQLTLEELNEICFYKTAIAFEATLVMPAILAGAKERKLQVLKKLAYHAGIAFQIRDDLLDLVGDERLLGKPVGLDQHNNRSTFATVLGYDGAQKAMWDHYCHAMEALQQLQPRTTFLSFVLNYMIHRDR